MKIDRLYRRVVLVGILSLAGVVPVYSQSGWEELGNALKGLASGAGVRQGTADETVFVLRADGRSFIRFSSTVSPREIDLWVDKGDRPSDWLYFHPQDVRIVSGGSDADILKIPSGGYSTISQGFMRGKRFTENADGTYTYRSWDGEVGNVAGVRTRGYYNSGGFSRWNLAWIIPENVEIIKYEASVRGKWVLKPTVLSFYSTDVNHVHYTITYRVHGSSLVAMETLP